MQESALKLLTPNSVDVKEVSPNTAKIAIEPLERGFGHTLGNALRRVLLSSMTGSAVVDVEIQTVLHEYTTIEGVQEDVTEILLNIKQLAIRNEGGLDATLTISAKGAGPVRASDIKCDHNVEIVNGDHVIAHLTKEGELNLTMHVAAGRGYQPAASRVDVEDGDRPIGKLLLDASFSPINRVTYVVENARVEQRTDLDKLVLEIETNGTIDAQEAVSEASRLLHEQLSVFTNFTPDARAGFAAVGNEPPVDPI
ncbi:MAG: DNA-directed RNA polymerase subunit alpha, partial [Chromatiales bacterium]|nr:DNA-directed RNA polymerase subunit alpha [Chromatiales bacterium]